MGRLNWCMVLLADFCRTDCPRREASASRGYQWSKFDRVDHSTLGGSAEKPWFLI